MDDFNENQVDNIIGQVDLINEYINGKEDGAGYTPRECSKCNRWLKRGWKGDICSKCQFKAKYHRNVLNRIKYKFANNPVANPFTNDIDFTKTDIEFNKKVAKFVGIHTTDFDTNEVIIKKLEHFRNMYLNHMDLRIKKE